MKLEFKNYIAHLSAAVEKEDWNEVYAVANEIQTKAIKIIEVQAKLQEYYPQNDNDK